MSLESNPQSSADSFPFGSLRPVLFEPGELRDYVGFALRSLGRRWVLAISILVLFAATVMATTRSLPRRYHIEARLLTLPAEGAPGVMHQSTGQASGLLPSAAEVVLAHDNLIQLIRDEHLIQRWELSRGPILQLWDRLRMRRTDPAARERNMVRSLERRLTVQVKGSQVTLAFDWPEAETAVRVVHRIEQKLLDSRRDAELLPLERKAASLEASVEATQQRVDALAERIGGAIAQKRRGARPATVRALQAEGRFRDLPDRRLARWRIQLIANRRAIAELEDARRKRLSELNAALAEQMATLRPGNPFVMETQEKIRALDVESSELASRKALEEKLLTKYVRAGGKEIELTAEPSAWPAELREDDPAIAFDKASLAIQQSSLARLLDAAEEGRVAVAAARASFESRYIEMLPPEIPDDPVFPNPVLLLVAGLLGGAVVAFFGAVAADLSGGILRETWQVRRKLDVPLLAEVPAP